MTDQSLASAAETTVWVMARWEALSASQQSLVASTLTLWIDRTRLAREALFKAINNEERRVGIYIPKAEITAEALHQYFISVENAEAEYHADLLALFGIHSPAGDDRRAAFFNLAQLNKEGRK